MRALRGSESRMHAMDPGADTGGDPARGRQVWEVHGRGVQCRKVGSDRPGFKMQPRFFLFSYRFPARRPFPRSTFQASPMRLLFIAALAAILFACQGPAPPSVPGTAAPTEPTRERCFLSVTRSADGSIADSLRMRLSFR